jgi:glycosyltransferase involved in cell wall biosynthesis
MCCSILSQLPAPPGGKKGWPWTEESPQLPDAMSDGHPWPRISIVTPSFNQGQFVEETIRSVLLQGYPNLEYIIIDGVSTDGSVEIIKRYEKWLTYWVSEPDRGQSAAINKGFKRARGVIYTWLNSDDLLLKDALRNVAVAYSRSPEAGGWFGGCSSIDMDGRIGLIRWPSRLDVDGIAEWRENWVIQPACFFSEKAWHKCGPLDEDLYYGMDFDLFLKIAKEFSIEKVNHIIATNHVHEDMKWQSDLGQALAVQFVIQVRHGYEGFAIKDISRWVNDYMELNRKFNRMYRISRFPLLRPMVPMARIFWKKLL